MYRKEIFVLYKSITLFLRGCKILVKFPSYSFAYNIARNYKSRLGGLIEERRFILREIFAKHWWILVQIRGYSWILVQICEYS